VGKKLTAHNKYPGTQKHPIVNPLRLEENEIATKITDEYTFTDNPEHTADPDNPAAPAHNDGVAV
jgi:hypothetical protein